MGFGSTYLVPTAPCRGCEDRTSDCHGTCEKYLKFYAERRRDYKVREALNYKTKSPDFSIVPTRK